MIALEIRATMNRREEAVFAWKEAGGAIAGAVSSGDWSRAALLSRRFADYAETLGEHEANYNSLAQAVAASTGRNLPVVEN